MCFEVVGHQPTPASPPLLWDIFCRVIDNLGDIGVCWRLSSQLAQRGQRVRLWVDDPSALRWMAPGALEGAFSNVQVLHWSQSQLAATVSSLPRADVWIEAFGCEIAPEFIAACAQSMRARGQNDAQRPVWINLEYLSAERFVERCHTLPSPILSGPAAGWTKYFFYPGFTRATGGLLRETDLLQRQAQFDRTQWLAQQGIPWAGERLVSLFCYEPPVLGRFLQRLQDDGIPTRLLVTHGRSSAALRNLEQNGLQPPPTLRKQLSFFYLPALTQLDFDHLLWACDFNCVRGEDSLVRALWAAKPFVWHIYPQSDDAHHDKLKAFLDMLGADAALRQLHYAWNGVANHACETPLLDENLDAWQTSVQLARSRLLQMDDLVSQLQQFQDRIRHAGAALNQAPCPRLSTAPDCGTPVGCFPRLAR